MSRVVDQRLKMMQPVLEVRFAGGAQDVRTVAAVRLDGQHVTGVAAVSPAGVGVAVDPLHLDDLLDEEALADGRVDDERLLAVEPVKSSGVLLRRSVQNVELLRRLLLLNLDMRTFIGDYIG